MGRRGPKPEPAAVQEQKAPVRSRHARKNAGAEPIAPGAAGEPPKWLVGEGRKVWDRLSPTLRAVKLLSDADVPAFARYCRHFARWIDLQQRLDKHGDIYEIETASGKVRRADPAFMMADRLDRMMLAFEDRFGLNPAERQRIMVSRAATGAHDLFSAAGGGKETERRADDAAATATAAALPEKSPVGMLN